MILLKNSLLNKVNVPKDLSHILYNIFIMKFTLFSLLIDFLLLMLHNLGRYEMNVS